MNFSAFTFLGDGLGRFLKQVNSVTLAFYTQLVNSINLQETNGIEVSWVYQSSVISIAFSAMSSLAAEFLARLACFMISTTYGYITVFNMLKKYVRQGSLYFGSFEGKYYKNF